MKINGKRKALILLCIVGFLVVGCKEKKVTKIKGYEPSRSDYIVASSYAYIAACDSGAKITARQIEDSASFPLLHSKEVSQRLSLYDALGKRELALAFDDQIRRLMASVVSDLHIPSARFMTVKEADFPKDFLGRNILMQRYLEPMQDSLSRLVKHRVYKAYQGTRAQRIWGQVNRLYNTYYGTSTSPQFTFNNLSKRAVYQYIRNAKVQEDSVKYYYARWTNPQASKAMAHYQKHR